MVSITKNHYELQIEGDSIRLIYFTNSILDNFVLADSPKGKILLDKFNKAQPRTSFTPERFPSENLNIYNG